jgi:hypothetical protein
MERARRSLRLLLVAALAALVVGCGLVQRHRPYANDPILRERTPIWGDHGRARTTNFNLVAEPVPPVAPNLADQKPPELVVSDGSE